VLRMLMKHVTLLSGWLRIRMNSRLVFLILYIRPPCVPTYAPLVCIICHYSDHDSTSCPYCIYDDGLARLSSMIETMNKQQVEFANKTREYDLSYKTNLRLSSPKLDVCLCDDGVSFLV